MNQVIWVCENCKTENIDLRKETALPKCGGCATHFDWDDIACNSDDFEAYLNLIDKRAKDIYQKSTYELFNHESSTTLDSFLRASFNDCIKVDEVIMKITQGM